MKVFLSWSGEKSKSVATLLSEWVPSVLQSIQTYFSGSDIEAGQVWVNELQYQLEESKVGIICLTPENLEAPWILYEAGALTKSLGNSFVIPYLIGFSPRELKGPLVQFQAITTSKEDNFKLLRTLNRLTDNSISDDLLAKAFNVWWPVLESKLSEIINSQPQKKQEKRTKLDIEISPELEKSIPSNVVELLNEVIKQMSTQTKENVPKYEGNRVFIVHGQNELIKITVARLIEKLGLVPIILNEQPNQGQTIIEKFESYSNSDFAVILMTGDDKATIKSKDDYSLRARQNVIFELGFFAAKLGRKRIAVLYEQGIEIPSDLNGIVYIPIDSGGAWQFHLAKEFRTSGLKIDLNNII